MIPWSRAVRLLPLAVRLSFSRIFWTMVSNNYNEFAVYSAQCSCTQIYGCNGCYAWLKLTIVNHRPYSSDLAAIATTDFHAEAFFLMKHHPFHQVSSQFWQDCFRNWISKVSFKVLRLLGNMNVSWRSNTVGIRKDYSLHMCMWQYRSWVTNYIQNQCLLLPDHFQYRQPNKINE